MHLACCRIHIMRTSGAAVLIICGTKRRQLITVNSSVTNAVCVKAVCCLKCGCFIRLGPCKFQDCLSIGAFANYLLATCGAEMAGLERSPCPHYGQLAISIRAAVLFAGSTNRSYIQQEGVAPMWRVSSRTDCMVKAVSRVSMVHGISTSTALGSNPWRPEKSLQH